MKRLSGDPGWRQLLIMIPRRSMYNEMLNAAWSYEQKSQKRRVDMMLVGLAYPCNTWKMSGCRTRSRPCFVPVVERVGFRTLGGLYDTHEGVGKASFHVEVSHILAVRWSLSYAPLWT